MRLTGSFDVGLDLGQAGHGRQAEFAGEAIIARRQSTSGITLASRRSMRPWPLSCSMWLAMACGGACLKQASITVRVPVDRDR